MNIMQNSLSRRRMEERPRVNSVSAEMMVTKTSEAKLEDLKDDAQSHCSICQERYHPDNEELELLPIAELNQLANCFSITWHELDKKDLIQAITNCLDDTQTQCKSVLKINDCGHCFHKECIKPWFQEHNSCPVCRHTIQ